MTKVTMPEPVAVVASDYALFWAGSGPIAPLVDRSGVKVGSLLITTDQAEAYANALVSEALTIEGVEDHATARVREALEEAATLCETDGALYTALDMADRIRALCPRHDNE